MHEKLPHGATRCQQWAELGRPLRRLHREAVEAAADRIGIRALAVVDQLRDTATDADPRAALTAVARDLLKTYSNEDAVSVRQLASAHVAQFPDLAASVRERTALRERSALADRPARLILDGCLRQCDPDLAAEHFLSLINGSLEYHPGGAPDTVADLAVDAPDTVADPP
ncbi:TetR/AcrR family transcriptional regulator C-terminal domain-containing protein [Streptomyces sp. NPDC006477]|uniref:TetR/AcrR family transcriptional regulator C-terminal domain-containing protein n=1 Tax=Streptomyces sp. NPDC006477 TaxID=3364747 RepID=UPI0036862DB4